jgi:hypothetical protein
MLHNSHPVQPHTVRFGVRSLYLSFWRFTSMPSTNKLTGRKFTSGGQLTAVACSLVLTACAARHQPSNPFLFELFREDQLTRTGGTASRTDDDRLKLVLGEIATGRAMTPEDQFHAALVLDHSGLTVRNGHLAAISPHDYLLGHLLAKNAFERGFAPARMLVAQTLDRYLSMTEGHQKYGTNRFINQQTGREEWSPIDRSTTDAERAIYGVPPLTQLLKRYPEATSMKPEN